MDLKSSDDTVASPSPLPEIPQRSNLPAVELTARERQIAILTAQGLQCDQIGARLGIEGKTVKVHRTNIFRKLGQRGIAQVTRYVIRQGWIEP